MKSQRHLPSAATTRTHSIQPRNVTFDLPHPAKVSVEVFDVAGRLVQQQFQSTCRRDNGQSVRIEATAWSSGLYLYKVIARSGTSSWIGTGQMMLLK